MSEQEKLDAALFDLEKRAMLLNRGAIVNLVSLCRTYRGALRAAMKDRHGDGSVNGAMMQTIMSIVDCAEQDATSENQ